MRRAILFVVLAMCAVLTLPQVAAAAEPRCFGKKATIVGTQEGDHIKGTPGADVILGLGGSDVIRGLGGDDLICAGKGYDQVYGGAGNDRIAGGQDVDSLLGNGGNDQISGGQGGDNLTGGPGSDSLLGGAGDDEFVGEPGDDAIDGGPGEDFINFEDAPGPMAVDLTAGTVSGNGSDTITGVEDILGSPYDDTIVGDSGPNMILDAGGSNAISGMAGDDTYWDMFATASDHFDGGEGEDWILYAFAEGPIQVDLETGTGSDTLIGVEDVYGSSGDDVIIGDAGPNQLDGGFDGDDTISGGEGDDLLDGGSGGADTISGGEGDDLLVGDEPYCDWFDCYPRVSDDVLDGGGGIDTVSYESADGPVQVDLAAGTATGQGSDTLAGIENVLGGGSDDTLTGDSGPNYLDGWDGDDVLLGAEGDDTLDGEWGTDTLDGGPGTDTCVNGETVSNCENSTLPAAGTVARGTWPAAVSAEEAVRNNAPPLPSAPALDWTLTNGGIRTDKQRSDTTGLQGDQEWALEDSNLRPLPRQGRQRHLPDQHLCRSELVSDVTGVPSSTV